MALAVAGLRHTTLRPTPPRPHRWTLCCQCHWGRSTELQQQSQDNRQVSRPKAIHTEGQAFPRTSRGGEMDGRDWVRGRNSDGHAAKRSRVSPLVSVDLWRAWNQCSRLSLDHDAVVHAFTSASAPATQLRLTARPIYYKVEKATPL